MAAKQFKCLICDSGFSTKFCLKTHEDSIHRNIKFDCQDCGKQYKQKGKLTLHINSTHKGIRYKCDQCDKEFAHSSSRYNHSKLVHELKKVECPLHSGKAKELCDFAFFAWKILVLGLIFASKMPAITYLLNQNLKCILCGDIDLTRFAENEHHGDRTQKYFLG